MFKIVIILRTTGKLYNNQQIYIYIYEIYKTYTHQCYDNWVKGRTNCDSSQISKHLHIHLLTFLIMYFTA
jgi:hypothetical protein